MTTILIYDCWNSNDILILKRMVSNMGRKLPFSYVSCDQIYHYQQMSFNDNVVKHSDRFIVLFRTELQQNY